MMLNNQNARKTLLGLAISVMLVGATRAGTVRVAEVDNGGISDDFADLAGAKTFDILISTAPGELIGAMQIYARTSHGVFFQHPLGSFTPPYALVLTHFPAAEFDTFLAAGVPDRTFIPAVVGASIDLGSPNTFEAVVLNDTILDATFAAEPGQNTGGVSNFLAARITALPGAAGLISFDVDFSGASPNAQFLDLPFHVVPEPASIALSGLAIVGAAGLARRRREMLVTKSSAPRSRRS